MQTRRVVSARSWSLFERSPHAERLRRRLLSTLAVALLVFGLLAALGLGLPALLLLALVASAGAGAALVVVDPGRRRQLRAWSRHVGRRRERRMSAVRVGSGGWPWPHGMSGSAPTARAADEEPTVEAAASVGAFSDGGVDDRDGLRCNAFGMRLRRAGEPERAAVMHEAARLIFAETGNRRGEALALNALGLTLSALGEHEQALDRFAQARALLRELGDEECEAKVIANIGLAKRQAGEETEAADLLQAALLKLEPHTPAYRIVEQRLRHAG